MRTGNRIHGRGNLLKKSERGDLGLALLSLVAIPGVPLTQEDIAAWTGWSRQNIYVIEILALRKVRNYLMFRNRPLWEELRTALFEQRSPARSTRLGYYESTRDPSLLS